MKTNTTMFAVLAFRYGSNLNTLPIGVFTSRANAENAAKQHREYRGGKYDHRIYEFTLDKWDDDPGHRQNARPCVESSQDEILLTQMPTTPTAYRTPYATHTHFPPRSDNQITVHTLPTYGPYQPLPKHPTFPHTPKQA